MIDGDESSKRGTLKSEDTWRVDAHGDSASKPTKGLETIVLPRNASRHFLASLDHVFELLNPLELLKITGSRWVASVCNP